MPQAIPLLLTATIGAAGLTGFGAIFAYLLVAYMSNKIAQFGLEEQQPDPLNIMSRQAVLPRTIIYGTAEISGPIVYAGGIDDRLNTGLSIIVVLTGHPVDAVLAIKVGEKLFLVPEHIGENNWVTTEDYSTNTRLFAVTGQDSKSDEALNLKRAIKGAWYRGSSNDGPLTSAEDSPNTLDQCCYISYLLKEDRELWPGVPNLKARVRGKLVRDPVDMYNRSIAPTDPLLSPKVFSNNWAACILDYLMDEDLGLGIPIGEIDLIYFRDAAILSDEIIAATGEKRYMCDGILKTDATPVDNLEKLLGAGVGYLVYTQGKYRLYGASYTIPLAASEDILTETDLLAPLKIQVTTPRRDRFNAVRGTYTRLKDISYWEDKDGAQTTEDFNEVTNELYRTADTGSDLGENPSLDGYSYQDINLPFTRSNSACQRIAYIVLNRARQGITVEAIVGLKALKYSVGDNIKVNFPSLAIGSEVNVGFEAAVLGNVIVSGGVVQSVPITSGGSGYNYPPKLTISSMNGLSAALISVIDQGSIVEVIVIQGGTLYTAADSVTVFDPIGASNAWLDKVFKIETWEKTLQDGIKLVLKEDSPSIYDETDPILIIDDSPDLVRLTSVADYTPHSLSLETGTSLVSTNADGTYAPALRVSFGAGRRPVSVNHYEIEMGRGGSIPVPIASISVADATEDPIGTEEYTGLVSFTTTLDIDGTPAYSQVDAISAIGQFDFNDNVNTGALPEYIDKKGNFQDFGEESIL